MYFVTLTFGLSVYPIAMKKCEEKSALSTADQTWDLWDAGLECKVCVIFWKGELNGIANSYTQTSSRQDQEGKVANLQNPGLVMQYWF